MALNDVLVNVGSNPNDKKGDSLRRAFQRVNAGFTELYTALGLTDATLNLGAFAFTGSTMTTTDSSAITIDNSVTVNSNLTIGGDLLPETNLGGNLGSPTQQWKSLYVSTNTIYIGGVPLSIDDSNNLTINGSNISSGITASSSDTLTNKTINIQTGQNNTFQIQGNSISSYSGSGAIVALTTMPTLNGLNIGNGSGLTVDGGTGSYYWAGQTSVPVTGIDKAGVYRSSSSSTNSLFTFGANGSGTMSASVEGSLFVGTALPSNNGGLNTNYSGWLVVQAGAKFGGDLNTLGGLHFDEDTTGYIQFQNGKVFKVVPAPTHSYGASGDTLGHVAFDSSYIYYCTANYSGLMTISNVSTQALGAANGYFFNVPNADLSVVKVGWTITGPNIVGSATITGKASSGVNEWEFQTDAGSVDLRNQSGYTLSGYPDIWKRVALNATSW